jgi:hypothetical protein
MVTGLHGYGRACLVPKVAALCPWLPPDSSTTFVKIDLVCA